MLKSLPESGLTRLSFALFVGGLAAVTLSQASLTRVEAGMTELHEFHSPALSSIEDIRANLGEAVQEGFAYVISGVENEKHEFMTWNSTFPQAARDFETIARLHEADEVVEREAFAEIVVLQAKLAISANKMFREYEQDGSVSSQTFKQYEAIIDRTLTALDAFVAIERSEVAMIFNDHLNHQQEAEGT